MEQNVYKVKRIPAFESEHSIYIAITNCMDSDYLKANWRTVRDEFMQEYQNKITDEFSRWNFYIFYVVENLDDLDGDLRYLIEHDMVSSRKILVDADTISGQNDEFYTLVKKYIIYDVNLVYDDEEVITSFEKETSVINLIKSLEHED